MKIGSAVVGALIAVSGFLFPVSQVQSPTVVDPIVVEQPSVGATLPQATGLFQTTLQTGITSSATSMTLAANAVRGGGSISGYTCFTVDEGSAQAEVICGTVSSTSVTSMLRGVSYADGVTEVTANKFAHRRGASIKITDFPILQILKAQNNGDTTLPNAIKYASGVAPSTADDLTDKGYVDGVAIAGGADASTTVKGISKMSTAPASATEPIAVGDNDTRVSTQGENDAQVGNNTDIAVGTGNKFVTQTGLQHGAELYAADAGSNDTYVITLSPIPTSYTNGMVVRFKANTINTGAATLNVNSLGAITIVKAVSTTLADGDIAANQFVTVIYNGTNFVLQNPVANAFNTDVQTFTANGTWTKPSGAKSVKIQAWGAGGSGGGAGSGTGSAGGGGGGSFVEWLFNASDLSSTEAVVVGVGPAGGVGNANGAVGPNSTVGTTKVIAYGGGGGSLANAGSGGAAGGGGGISAVGVSVTNTATGGAGGAPSGGAAGAVGTFGGGGGGGNNTAGGLSVQGGGGGGGGGSGGGNGGTSYFGGGGGGGGGNNSAIGGTSTRGGAGGAGSALNANGSAGSAPGGGGGGAQSTSGAFNGGAGGDGKVIITTYF